MRVDTKFVPITITLETPEEVYKMKEIMSYYQTKHGVHYFIKSNETPATEFAKTLNEQLRYKYGT